MQERAQRAVDAPGRAEDLEGGEGAAGGLGFEVQGGDVEGVGEGGGEGDEGRGGEGGECRVEGADRGVVWGGGGVGVEVRERVVVDGFGGRGGHDAVGWGSRVVRQSSDGVLSVW